METSEHDGTTAGDTRTSSRTFWTSGTSAAGSEPEQDQNPDPFHGAHLESSAGPEPAVLHHRGGSEEEEPLGSGSAPCRVRGQRSNLRSSSTGQRPDDDDEGPSG